MGPCFTEHGNIKLDQPPPHPHPHPHPHTSCELFCGWSKIHSLQWRYNRRDRVSNHQPHDCLLNRLFRRRSKKTPKLRVTGLCAGNSPGTGEFPAQMTSNAENVSIWWHHVLLLNPAGAEARIFRKKNQQGHYHGHWCSNSLWPGHQQIRY